MNAVGHWLRIQSCMLDPLGRVLVMFGVSMVLVSVLSWATEAYEETMVFLVTGAACVAAGTAGWRLGRERLHEIKARHASLLVITIWFLLPLVGAIPLLRHTDGSLVDAYFEAVSGLTASGATVLSGIDDMPTSIKFWRGAMTWMGGMGLIVLAVAILPTLGLGGRQMMKTEITGISDNEITPRVKEVAKGLWGVYAGLTAACAAAYYAAGMSFLDAVVHSFTTMGLGGFSNHDASFGYFDSPLIEGIAVVFMVVAGLNFATHFKCLHSLHHKSHTGNDVRRRWSPLAAAGRFVAGARDDPEYLPYLLVLLLAATVVVAAMLATSDAGLADVLRVGVFNTVSVITTTGYSNADYYLHWPLALSFFVLLLANITSCSGSTGGGIKMVRVLAILKRAKAEQAKILHPHSYQQVRVGNMLLPDSVVISIFFFVLTYLGTVFLFTLAMLALQPDIDALTALSAVLACVSNTGPGLGEVGPASTYASLNPAATMIGAAAMLLGRLEFLLFLLLFSRSLWR